MPDPQRVAAGKAPLKSVPSAPFRHPLRTEPRAQRGTRHSPHGVNNNNNIQDFVMAPAYNNTQDFMIAPILLFFLPEGGVTSSFSLEA